MPWWNPFGKRTDLEEQTAREQRAVNATARQFNGFGNAVERWMKDKEEQAERAEQERKAALQAEGKERMAKMNAYPDSEEGKKEFANRNAKEKLEQDRMKLARIFQPLVDSSSRDSETGQLTDTAMIEFKALMNLWKEAEDMYAANIPIDYDELRHKADAVAPAAAGTLRASYENAIRGGRRSRRASRRRASRRRASRRRASRRRNTRGRR